jgi:thymidylate kinase
MTQVFIIEGPDRCGKGTIIENLIRCTNAQNYLILHSGKPNTKNLSAQRVKENQYYYNHNQIKLIKENYQNYDLIIFDRSYIGEYVYGNLYRSMNYTPEDLKNFEQSSYINWLNKTHNCSLQLILVSDSPENRLSREDGNSLAGFKLGVMKSEELLFKEYFNASTIENKFYLDWTKEDFSQLNNIMNSVINDCSQINDIT